ncbi:MAG: TonB-dependent receptor [Sphingomonadales bacterium]
MLKNWLESTTAIVAIGTIAGTTFNVQAQEVSDQDQQADAAAFEIEEIVVTARRRSELMQDIPISMTAVGRLDMDRAGYETIGDLSFGVANFSFADQGSILGDFGMRGITTNVANPGVESAMAVYVDGVLIGRPASFDAVLQGVEQVEILRGPQGTLFGKNTVAGAVNITTQRPTEEVSGNLKLEAGRFQRGAASGSLNVPLLGDKLMARASLSVEQQDGWIRNLNDARRFNGEDNWSGRFQLLARPSDTVEVYWTIDRFFDDRTFVAQLNDDPDSLKTNPGVDIDAGIIDIDSDSRSKRDIWGTSLEVNVETSGGYAITGVGAYRQTNFDSLFDGDTTRQRLQDTTQADNTDQYTFELRVASPEGRKLDWVAGAYVFIQDIKGFNERRFFPKDILAGCTAPVSPDFFRGSQGKGRFFPTSRFVGFDAAGLPIWEFDFDNDGVFGEAADVTTPVGATVNENIGCHNPGMIAFARHLPGGDAEDQFIPFFDGLTTVDDVPEEIVVRQSGSVNTDAYALFAHANYHFTDQLTLTGGARHTWENKDVDLTQTGMINIARPSFTKQDSRKDREWSGTGSLTYEWNDEVTTYIKYAHGFKSGGFQFDVTQGEKVSAFNALATKSPFIPFFLKANPGATKQDVINALIAASADPNEAPDNVEFEPENVNVYEVGLKTQLFNRKLRLNIAGFLTDYNNVQQNILNLATGIIVLNVPGARVWGFEADMVARPTSGLTVTGGVGTAFSDIRNALIIPNPVAGQPPLVDTTDFLGLRLAQSPEVTANASVTYTMPVGATGNIVVRGDWSFTGSIFHELDPNPSQRAKVFEASYNLVNARIGYVSDANDWEVFFWGKNIFNERYAAFRRANPINRNFGIPAGGAVVNAPPFRFPGSATGQSISGLPRTWGVTLQKHF